MRVLAKYLIVKRIIEEVQTSFGMALTDKIASAERYYKGEVISVGDEITNIKEKDIIMYDKNNSFDMLLNGEKLTIIQAREVVLIYD